MRRYECLYRLLGEKAEPLSACRILEIGTCRGLRARQMITTAISQAAVVSYWGLDLFEDLTEEVSDEEGNAKRPDSMVEVERFLARSNPAELVLLKGRSHDSLDELIATGAGPMDFVFIDGGHRPETVRGDWERVTKLLGSHGVVVFDDYYPERLDFGAAPVIEEIQATGEWQVRFLEPTDTFQSTGPIQLVEIRR